MKTDLENSNSGAKFLSMIAFCLVAMSALLFAQDYESPIGIPAPEFGINETVESVYGDSSFYTHYIDNLDTNATDTENPNGSSLLPRKSIPKTLAAGSVVEIHGGPYNIISGTYTMNGTIDNPVFFRGVSDTLRPVISNSDMRFSGQYYIVENLDFYNQTRIRYNSSTSYGSLRNCEVHNPIGATGASNPTINVVGDNMVIYNCEIHDNIREVNIDCHGVQVGNYAEHVWIVDNHIYNNGGDGIQACHGCDPGPRYVYIGRNDFHGDLENAVDLKYASDVIISENKIHGYRHSSSTGIVSPIVIGSDGAPTRVWVMFNEIYDATKGIRIEEIDDLWIIGNLIYDIDEAGIIPEKKGTKTHIVGNTLDGMEKGISGPWRENFTFYILNNIFSNISIKSIQMSGEIEERSEISNNIFWQAPWFGDNFLTDNPLYSDAANREYSLTQYSQAIDAGLAWEGIFNEYKSLYGVDIKKDLTGEIRPQGIGWDIGAYEYPTGTYPSKYNLIIDYDESQGSVSPSGGPYSEGSIINLSATPIVGYGFEGWSGDINSTDNPVSLTMDSDKSITATFIQQAQFTITVNTSGSGDVVLNPNEDKYLEGAEVAARAIPENGYQFDGWSGDISSTQNPIEIVVNDNVNITANFSEQEREFIEYSVKGITASTFENPNVPTNTRDNNLSTRWSAEGNQWISYELEEIDTVSFISLSVHLGHQVRLQFEIEVSIDNINWIEVFRGLASGTTLEQEVYDFEDTPARYVRILGHGNEANNWNSITEVDIFGLSKPVSVNEVTNNLPRSYSLNAYPNPFNPSTTINYTMPENGFVEISIYSIDGSKVEKLVSSNKKAGNHSLVWDAKDKNGSQLSSGVYLLHMNSDAFSKTSKLMFLK